MAVATATIAAAGLIIANWDKIKAVIDGVFGFIDKKTKEFDVWAAKKIQPTLDKVNEKLKADPADNPADYGAWGAWEPLRFGGAKNAPGFAKGGVVGRPTLAMVGEGGDAESIIPHNKSARSMALWENAGRAIGALPAGGGGAMQVTFAPVQNFYGQTDAQAVGQANRLSLQELRRMLNDLVREDRRLRLA